jgi:hypothetical protein
MMHVAGHCHDCDNKTNLFGKASSPLQSGWTFSRWAPSLASTIGRGESCLSVSIRRSQSILYPHRVLWSLWNSRFAIFLFSYYRVGEFWYSGSRLCFPPTTAWPWNLGFSHMLKWALEATILLQLYPKSRIEVSVVRVVILADDGDRLYTAINAASLAFGGCRKTHEGLAPCVFDWLLWRKYRHYLHFPTFSN